MNTRNLLNNRAPVRRAPASSAAMFLFGALLCAAAVALTYWAFVRTTTGQLADESAWREAEVAMPGTRVPVLEFLDKLPLLSVFIAGAVVLVMTIRRRRLAPAVIALTTFAAANISSQMLKRFVLDRPDRGVITLDFNSLPSGHTTLAASAAAVVFLLASPNWRPAVAVAGGSYAVLAGAATFINLWHRPADVVASLLVVATWTLLGGLVMLRTTPDWNYWPPGGRGRGAAPVFAAVCWIPGLLALLASGGAYLYATSGSTVLGNSESMQLYFWSGLGLIVGVGYVLSALGCWVFSLQAGDPDS